jgi:hypothetical protein
MRGANASPQTESRIFGKSANPANRNGKLANLGRPLTACNRPRDARGVSRRSGLPRSGKPKGGRNVSHLPVAQAGWRTFLRSLPEGTVAAYRCSLSPVAQEINWAHIRVATPQLGGPSGPLFLRGFPRNLKLRPKLPILQLLVSRLGLFLVAVVILQRPRGPSAPFRTRVGFRLSPMIWRGGKKAAQNRRFACIVSVLWGNRLHVTASTTEAPACVRR